MEITWYGQSFFSLSERNHATVVTDPYDHQIAGYQPIKLKADIVTISQHSPNHNNHDAVSGNPFIISGPGEYELGNVFITGIQILDKNQDHNNAVNTVYVFAYHRLKLVHLGHLNHVPGQSDIEDFGPVHIALVPIGGGSGLNASKASEIISLLEPNIVIPMHYATMDSQGGLDSINKFLKEMGLTEVETLPSYKISSIGSLPEETQVVVLDHQHN